MSATPRQLVSLLRRRPVLLATGLLAALGSFVYFATPSHLQASDGASPVAPPAPKVTVAPVEQEQVTEFEEITGHVDATETVDLRARVSGHLATVNFAAGKLVKKGDLLFTIDPRWYQARFDLATARSDVAAREARRSDDLLASAAISHEEAESRRAVAAEARAQLATAGLDLDYTQVRAPISGRISRALVTPGNLVAGSAGGGTLLTTIVATGDAYVYADLDEATLLKFNRLIREHRMFTRNGRIPVDLQLADEEDFPRHGYIESSDNHVNPATGSLTLRMVFANLDDALVPGLFARVRVPVGAPHDALLVSERAIGTDQNQKFVFAVGPNHTVAYRTVKLGSTYQGKRVVREGLQPGDTIIVNGLQHVRPGMTVQTELESVAQTAPAGTGTVVAALR